MRGAQKKKRGRPIKKMSEPLKQMNLNAAGIDVGAQSHWVAVPTDRDENPVQEFGSVTSELERLAAWLTQCKVTTVAMESTGVYWIPLFELLEERGFEVKLVDPHHLKSVPGRKTDVVDCQWIQQLHTYGLLTGAFRPEEKVSVLRSYLRQRCMLAQNLAEHTQHMQKAMTQMNVKLQHVVADITGMTGMRIIRAILNGERNERKLAKLRDPKCRHSERAIAESLRGNWRTEHLFALKQAVELHDFYAKQIEACDLE
jgi:transposase